MLNFPLPIAFPEKHLIENGSKILAADIGGTKTDMALFELQNGKLSILQEKVYESKAWTTFSDIVLDFSQHIVQLPERLSVAVAGPVQNGKVIMTNLNWLIDAQQLREVLGVGEVVLLNDLEAEAYGLGILEPDDILTIYNYSEQVIGNVGIIAPGTGLGEAGLFWDGEFFHPFATEGGHTDFGPRENLDIELLQYLQGKFPGHVSWERLVSGQGIVNIYQFLRDVKNQVESDAWLETALKNGDPAKAIGEGASRNIPICENTIELFVQYLAAEAGNIALKLKATGGIFIGGGITPKLWNAVLQTIFIEKYLQVGRLQPLLKAVSVHLVMNAKTVLLGAAYFGCYEKNRKTKITAAT